MAISDQTIIKAVVEQTHTCGALMLNVHYWKTGFDAPEAEEDVMDDLDTRLDAMYGEIDQLQHSGGSYDLYRYYYWTGSVWQLVGSRTPTPSMTDTGEAVPSGCCMVIRAYTTKSKSIGRKFLGGFTEDEFSGLSWSTALQTAAAAFLAKWYVTFAPRTGVTYFPGVEHSLGGFYMFNGTGVVNAIPGYQRRRKQGVGA